MLRLWIVNSQIFLDTHRKSTKHDYCGGSAYNLMFNELFCTSREQYLTLIEGGLFPETAIDAKAFLEDYFKIDLTL